MVFIRGMKTKTAKEKEGNGLHKGDEDQSGKRKRGKWSSPKKEHGTCPLIESKKEEHSGGSSFLCLEVLIIVAATLVIYDLRGARKLKYLIQVVKPLQSLLLLILMYQ